ncbi:MAG: UvrD-helicase domain-containing protein [Bacteroidota bacterium]
MQKFDVKNVALQGVNLIDASAGTGKTYSVAILVLRLLIEKKIPIERILMVTFTNAAVAEMALRIRKFIRQGIQAIEGKGTPEKLIQEYISHHLEKGNSTAKELQHLLNTALVGLDEASIQTIHSFCQESLQLFAFETDQAYGMKLQEDLSPIANRFVADFWRKEVTGLSVDFLAEMQENNITLGLLKKTVSEHLAGKEFDFTATDLKEIEQTFLAQKKELEEYLIENREHLLIEVQRVKIPYFVVSKKAELIQILSGNIKELVRWLSGNQNYKTSLKDLIFSDLITLSNTYDQTLQIGLKTVIHNCIESVVDKITNHLKKHHLLTYDEMISKLHRAVLHKPKLRQQLASRFDAVFIDEFQDTDRLQYEIYDQLYAQDKILFYIGDPKQSIYSWRKADLNTYFEASQKPGVKRYTMEHNFRSTPELLQSLNHFFAIPNPFLTEDIQYLPVKSGLTQDREGIKIKGQLLAPIQIFNAKIKSDIEDRVLSVVASLLDTETLLNGKPFKLSDLVILVRTKKEGAAIKNSLSQKGIPAVNVDETRIFETQEAEFLQYILETVLEITWRGVNKALQNPFTGWKADDILSKDSDKLVSQFKSYQQLWEEKGIYRMIRQYLLDFGVEKQLLNPENHLGKRILSNLNQLVEILQETEFRQELRPSGLLSFLQKQRIQEAPSEENKYLQRLEDDQEAITIMTIHKAKGLEFPVVIAPYLNLKPSSRFDTIAYRDLEGNYKFDLTNLGLADDRRELYEQQTHEENHRLLYVTLTRAVYHCFIFNAENAKDDALSPFLRAKENQITLFPTDQFPYPEVAANFSLRRDSSQGKALEVPSFTLPDQYWRKMSFSYLTRKAKPTPKLTSGELSGPYEEFIFQKLPRGAAVGDLLHYIFERVDFQSQDSWQPIVEKAIQRYFPQFESEMLEGLQKLVARVAQQILSQVSPDFSLSNISLDRKVAEWEFDLSSVSFDPAQLSDIPISEDYIVRVMEGQNLTGILNGLVDLIFEQEGRYYILDWKSNYLGDAWENYQEEGLVQAMNENNYHLQYLLYTYALHRYLQLSLENYQYENHIGGVFYLFLRGLNPPSSSGVFYTKPSWKQIQFLESLFAGRDQEIPLHP